jgi:glucosamine-6-phosphate deaminase
MEVIVYKNDAAVAEKGAELVEEMLLKKPAAIFGFATGSTPIEMYRRLAARHREGAISFRDACSFNLDEYLGIDPGHPNSYRAFMNREFFDHVDLPRQRIHLPECAPGENPGQVATRYERMIDEVGGIDLQVLGIGYNGHIGFNEPSSSLASRTRVKTLTRRTLEDNQRLFAAGEQQPRLAITMGIATIMGARRILLLATGEHKAEAVARMIEGPITAMCPASVLQLHEFATVLLDEGAAARLQNRAYYDLAHEENEALRDRFGAFYAGD